MAQHNEIEFEREFAEYLADHRWLYSLNDTGYDRERALFPEDVIGWLADTQPEQLEKVVKQGSGDSGKQQAQLLDRIVKVLDTPLDNGGGNPQPSPQGILTPGRQVPDVRLQTRVDAE
jgi:type I restriction enzyme, R subunit